jgi:hypothetical protein
MWLSTIIRKYNDVALQSQIPPDIAEELKLKPRDLAIWKKEVDGSFRLKFMKREEAEPAAP